MRAHTFDMVYMYHFKLAHQVQSLLAKVELCRTKALGGHVYRCSGCKYELPVYNSCRDRHCPLCSGGQRAKWLDKMSELFLPHIDYFQIVFTLPSQLTSFTLGNRRPLLDLLLRAAWQGLDGLLRETLGIVPAATLVLHTWNQELDVHPHVHALVPGGFPSLDGQQWITPKHPQHKRRRQAYLCNVIDLGQRFRQQFVKGLRRLYKQGKLNFQHESAAEPGVFELWIAELEAIDWNVYIQGPPRQGADPSQVAKYLARLCIVGHSIFYPRVSPRAVLMAAITIPSVQTILHCAASYSQPKRLTNHLQTLPRHCPKPQRRNSQRRSVHTAK